MIVGVIVGVGVIMVVVVRMPVAAAAAAVVRVLVLLGIDQRRVQLLLDGDRGFARRLLVLDAQRHDLGAEAHVVDGAEVMAAQAALAVEHQQRRRALHAVGLHRLGQAQAVHLVDGDGELDVLGLEERLELRRRHVGVVLEHHVQADDGDLIAGEGAGDAAGLRQRMAQGARAQHLEGDEDDDLALQLLAATAARGR